ncbi:MAG: TAXI family TRAP transporter solute-binding subunit [Methylocystaceae bacterium]|nr:TAXI family TRAP transporter solute-binding subunit [Methylocystaceae bacterium]
MLKKIAVIASSVVLSFSANAALSADLERTMVWTSYDLGSSGYAEASAIGNALQEEKETRIRIVPSGTSVGRILPLTTGKAKYGFLANEVFFATEAMHEFSDPSWGPQDLRIVMGRPAVNGLAVAADAGVKTISDLRDKRVGYVKGNPSVNVKTDAQLAYGGLTRKDVDVVFFGSYSAMGPAMEAGQIDARNAVPSSSVVREMEASSRGLYWPAYDPKDTKAWEAVRAITDFQSPVLSGNGAGLSEDKPVWLMGYRYPMITTYAQTSQEDVYQLVKAIDETYDVFKNATSGSSEWAVTKALRTPMDAPIHDGAVRYAKEKGIWTEEDQAWQDARLVRLEKTKRLWDEAQAAFNEIRIEKKEKGVKVDIQSEWPVFWQEYRDKNS